MTTDTFWFHSVTGPKHWSTIAVVKKSCRLQVVPRRSHDSSERVETRLTPYKAKCVAHRPKRRPPQSSKKAKVENKCRLSRKEPPLSPKRNQECRRRRHRCLRPSSKATRRTSTVAGPPTMREVRQGRMVVASTKRGKVGWIIPFVHDAFCLVLRLRFAIYLAAFISLLILDQL
jgi:hypothetical protein